MWSALALFTAASGAVPPFQLSAICFLIASLIGLSVMLRQPIRFPRAAATDQGLGARPVRPVWLSLPLFYRAEKCACGRGRLDCLSLAAADRGRLGLAAW
jgi:hypothetical protein